MVLCRESEPTAPLLKKQHEHTAQLLDVKIVKKPLHTSLVHGLNSRHQAFSATVRLAKRWIASQMLSEHISEESIELMVASLFVSLLGTDPPNTHTCGFLRFLSFLAHFDWKNEPLIVNLNGELKSDDVHTIRENFTTNRSKHPSMFIATPYSKHLSTWTTNLHPSEQILLRVQLLA